MSKYSEQDVRKVREADIRLFVDGTSPNKTKQDVKCPFCGKEKKFNVVRTKQYNMAKCWACGEGFSGPVEAYAHMMNLDIKRNYVECIEGVAKMASIYIEPEEKRREERVKETKKNISKTFAARQLEGSGLTVEDIMATVVEGGQEATLCPMRPGTFGPNFTEDRMGTDMLLYYYDLHGRPVQYPVKGLRGLRNYIRVRYANPEAHKDDNGDPVKYRGPAGAAAPVWIPEKVRRMYKAKTPIDTLFLQEGEKKAEKACKHGMISLGLQGIWNTGNKQDGLIQAIQDVVTRCRVKNIVLVMDSDWNNLSRHIKTGERADERPVGFAGAVCKFKQYMQTFHNLGHDVEIWWAHVNENEKGDKGVDDLLVNTLNGREHELMEDIDKAMHSFDCRGKYIDFKKITAMSDAKIRAFWCLDDWPAFFELHKDRLSEVPTFKLGQIRYKVEEGKLVPVSRYSSDVDIFTIEKDSKDNDKVVLNYTETFRFLSASGFFRLAASDDDADGYDYIRIDDGIISRSAPYRVRDFIRDYIKSNCKSALVHEYFMSKLDVLLPDKKLESLEMIRDTFNNFEPDIQRNYYNNGQVEITARDIKPGQPISNVWNTRILPRNFRRIPVIEYIDTTGDYWMVKFTEEGMKSDFVRYIINTSNNYFTHDKPREVSQDERFEWDQHIVNKITAIGYLLTDWKYPSDRKAVVVQDHRISEVGQAWGGAGKSILGYAIGHVTVQKVYDGKKFDPKADFALDGVTRATRNIFIDDVKTNFAFESLFNWITGNLEVNPKGKTPYTIMAADSPKILLTTNHAIKDADQGSVKRRIAYMEFSSWYNQEHTPVEDFGHQLFDEWDEHQWQLFDNFMAECVMYYLRSFELSWHKKGEAVVPPPMKNIELRTLRQSMSEALLTWADEYFDPSGSHLGERAKRTDLYNAFIQAAGGTQGHCVTTTNFKRKMIDFCRYKGYDFNINKPMKKPNGDIIVFSDWKPEHEDETFIGSDDKSNSAEYFTITQYMPATGSSTPEPPKSIFDQGSDNESPF